MSMKLNAGRHGVSGKYFKCPECGNYPDMIIEKHFSSRVERVWDGEDYEKVKDERKLSVIECPECGEELEEEGRNLET